MREVFKIPYPDNSTVRKTWNKEFSLNSIYAGKRWKQRRADAQAWHYMTASALNKCRCRKTPFPGKVILTFLWNDRLDLSNHAYIAKMIEDALKGKLIVDDTRKYVVGIRHYFHDEDYIKVIVEEVNDAESL